MTYTFPGCNTNRKTIKKLNSFYRVNEKVAMLSNNEVSLIHSPHTSCIFEKLQKLDGKLFW